MSWEDIHEMAITAKEQETGETMKPRFEEATYLKKARELALRIDELELKKKEGKDKEKKLISCLKKKAVLVCKECADACGFLPVNVRK